MANYYLDKSHGNVGKGLPHVEYILGEGIYDYKEDEIRYVSHNMPEWSTDEKDFWNEADYSERANGRVYTELKISLPNDLDLEENIRLVDDFVDETLGNSYYYSVAIHDKESSYKGIQNIHAHIMFSERKLDGIKRERENFFKRANTENPEKGGAKKERSWITETTLLELRKSWEVFQNDYLEKNNIDERVSCETLKKQRERALEQGDKLKADLLDREPINIKGQILMKRKRTPREEEELKEFKLKREIKNLKEEAYILELKELEKQKIKGLEVEIENLQEDEMNLPFSDILEMKSNIEMYNFEIEKNLNDLKNIRTLALKEVYPALFTAELELHNSLDTDIELLKIEELQKKVEIELSKVDNDILQEEITKVKEKIEERTEILKLQKAKELEEYGKVGRKITEEDVKEYIDKQVFETNKENYSKYLKEENSLNRLKNISKKINSLEKEENIENTALNILSGYKYTKIKNEFDMLKAKKMQLKSFIEANSNGRSEYEKKKLKSWEKEFLETESKLRKVTKEMNSLNEKLNTPEMKNKKIRIEKSVEKKLKRQKEQNLFEQFKTKKNIEILKSKVEIITDKEEILNSNISKIEKENIILTKSIDLIKKKIEQNKENLNDDRFEKEAYTNLTNGKIDEINDQYQELRKNNLKLRKEFEQVSGFKIMKKQKLANEINKIVREMKELENEDLILKESISTEDLYDEILNLKEKATNEIYEKEGKELEKKLKTLEKNLKDNKEEIKYNKKLIKKPKLEKNKTIMKPHTPTFKKFKEESVSQGHSSLRIWSNDQENDMDIEF